MRLAISAMAVRAQLQHALVVLSLASMWNAMSARSLSGPLSSLSSTADGATCLDVEGSQWDTSWVEVFSGDRLNATRWNVRNNESHCCPVELQLYTADSVAVGGGDLTLTTAWNPTVGPIPDGGGRKQVYNYTSGWVDTKGRVALGYGLFEVTASLPGNNVSGIWPAHWLMPEPSACTAADGCCWPVGGEIDIMEMIGNPFANAIAGSYRWGRACGEDEQVLPGGLFPPLGHGAEVDFSTPHTFQVLWNASTIAFGVDGCFYEARHAPDVDIPHWPMYWILDTAVAPYFPPQANAPFPARHVIHSMAWKRDPNAPILPGQKF